MAVKSPEHVWQDKNPWGVLKSGWYALKTMSYGVGKILRGGASVLTGAIMGAAGLSVGDIWEIQDAPIFEWKRLWTEKRAQVNANRSWSDVFLYGLRGFFTGLVKGTLEIGAGALQLLGGGIAVVAVLRDKLGLTPTIMDEIIKSGKPLGIMVGVLLKGIDGFGSMLEDVHGKFHKYEKLKKHGFEAFKQIKAGKFSSKEVGALMHEVGPELNKAMGGRLARAGKRFEEIAGTVNGQSYKMKDYMRQYNTLPHLPQKLSQPLAQISKVVQYLGEMGITPNLVQVVKNGSGIMLKGKEAAAGVRKILDLEAYRGYEVVVEGKSRLDVVRAAAGADDLLNKIGVFKFQEGGVVREIDREKDPLAFRQMMQQITRERPGMRHPR